MKFFEINELGIEVIKEKIITNRRAIFNLNCQKKVKGELENVHEPRRLRREIAQLKTALSLIRIKEQK
jgi:ribosomal protein L29